MKYADFEQVISAPRLGRYKLACGNNTRKAMTLYRWNLQLSQELYTVVSCFEIAVRNAIDAHYTALLGRDWLRDAAVPGGIFDTPDCKYTADTIQSALGKLSVARAPYTHHKLVAEMGFGFWRYLFAQHQFAAGHQILLQVFPAKPVSTVAIKYNQKFFFKQLAAINEVRNRMAHHEPICFRTGSATVDTGYVRRRYALLQRLFQWMGIDEKDLLFGLDHIEAVCDKIDRL